MVTVLPLPSSGWRVELNAGHQVFDFPDKRQAMSFALTWAGAHQPCEVRVYGSFRELDRSIALPEGNYRRPPSLDRRQTQVAIGFRDRRQQERRAQV